jgi:hypothetical protein
LVITEAHEFAETAVQSGALSEALAVELLVVRRVGVACSSTQPTPVRME